MSLDATVGGADANSYLTVSAADDYFNARLNSDDWLNAVPADKEKALIQATRILDQYCIWLGIKADTTTPQALEWPRIGIKYDGQYYEEYNVYEIDYLESFSYTWILDYESIPQQIQDGTCELALVLLSRDVQSDAMLSSLNVAGLKMDLSTTGHSIVPPHVWQIVSPLAKQLRGASGTVKIARG